MPNMLKLIRSGSMAPAVFIELGFESLRHPKLPAPAGRLHQGHGMPVAPQLQAWGPPTAGLNALRKPIRYIRRVHFNGRASAFAGFNAVTLRI
jgi:hypothetical protein